MVQKQARILIIGGDETFLPILEEVVKSVGMLSDSVWDVQEALAILAKENFHLILLDQNENRNNGFRAVQTLRERGIRLPLILLGEETDDFHLLYGLEIGADDYLPKPLKPLILAGKIKALIRRSQSDPASQPQILVVGPFSYDTSTLRFYKNGNEIPLTGKENHLIKLFLDNTNRVFSKEMLYDLVWNNAVIDDNVIMVYINRLRGKIEDNPSKPHYLQTVRGLGYRFVV